MCVLESSFSDYDWGLPELKEVAVGANYMRMGSTESSPKRTGGGRLYCLLAAPTSSPFAGSTRGLAARLDENSSLRTLVVSLGAYRESGRTPGRAGTGQ
jgi:hypothetical protein